MVDINHGYRLSAVGRQSVQVRRDEGAIQHFTHCLFDVAASEGLSEEKRRDEMQTLMSAGGDLNALNRDGHGIVYYAIKHGCVEGMKMALEYGADPTLGEAEIEFSDLPYEIDSRVVQGNVKGALKPIHFYFRHNHGAKKNTEIIIELLKHGGGILRVVEDMYPLRLEDGCADFSCMIAHGRLDDQHGPLMQFIMKGKPETPSDDEVTQYAVEFVRNDLKQYLDIIKSDVSEFSSQPNPHTLLDHGRALLIGAYSVAETENEAFLQGIRNNFSEMVEVISTLPNHVRQTYQKVLPRELTSYHAPRAVIGPTAEWSVGMSGQDSCIGSQGAGR